MEISNPHLIKLRTRVLLQYGINLDETSLSILSILQDDIGEKLTEQNQKLEEAVSSIERSKKSLQVDHNHPRWQAFWFGMGKWGIASILFIILIVVTRKQVKENAFYFWWSSADSSGNSVI